MARAAGGSRADPRITVKLGDKQAQVRFNAAVSDQLALGRFTHVLIAPTSSRIEFQFATTQMVDGLKAYALQKDGGSRHSGRSTARVTYVSTNRFPELRAGDYEVEIVGARPLKLAISIASTISAPIAASSAYVTRESSLIADEPLRTIVARIRERWQPIQIWMFGSRARGDAGPTSDWDLLAVVPDETPALVVDDPMATWDLRSISDQRTDITLVRRSDFADFRDVPNTLAYEVSHTGKLVG